MRVATYSRVSSEEQSQSGLSLEHQAVKTRALAGLHDWQIIEEVSDSGWSGKNLNRPGIQHLLSLVRARKIDGLVCYKLDRLTRCQADLLDLLKTCERYGVALVSVCEQLDTQSATGRFFVGMLGLIAEWERGVISERTSAALGVLRQQRRRFSRHSPYGFELGEDGSLVEVQSEQEAIRKARDLKASGLSLRAIAKELESAGHSPRCGRGWHPKTIASLLEG